jgi:Flp pilus assembly protein TadG
MMMMMTKKQKRNNFGAVIAEAALAIPLFFMVVFTMVELGRAMYIWNTLDIAAQRVAALIGTSAKRGPNYNLSSFRQYADRVRFPGSVIDSNQFSFDVTDALNNSTVNPATQQATGGTSTKVVITARFPPPNNRTYKIPLFDPGNLIGLPIFGPAGLTITSSATCFLERSRRPTIN